MDLRTLTKALEQQIIEADTRESVVGIQRERNHRYYTMEPMGNEMRGRSHYVDPSVMDVIESKKAFFREALAGSRRIVRFKPGVGESQADADAKTQYVEEQLKINDWDAVLRDCLHDALVAKRCVLYVEWADDTDTVLLEAAEAEPEHLQWQMQNIAHIEDMDLSAVQQNPDGTLTGNVRLMTNASRVKLKLVAPERYFRDPFADCVDDCAYVAFEEEITRGDLIESGYNESQVSGLHGEYRFRNSEEQTARSRHDGSYTGHRQYARIDEQELVTIRTTFTYLSLSEHMAGAPEEQRLYRIKWCGSEVLEHADGRLDIVEQTEYPFFEWAQYNIAHASNGMCDADVVAPMQKHLSQYKRQILDHLQITNNSRYLVNIAGVAGSLDALYDTVPGGVIEVRSPDAVNALPVSPLSPVTMPALEMMETDKESRSGSTRLGKGMNKDAVSKQNASDMIEKLTTAGNRRVASEVRDMVNTFIVPLMRQIYRLGVRHDRKAYQLEARGQELIEPGQWQEPAPHADVAIAITQEEAARDAMGLAQMHQMLSTDQQLSQLYGLQQRHALAEEMFELLGQRDASRYMMTPGDTEHQQVMQAMQAQTQEQEQMAAQQQQFQMQMLQSADQREWQRFAVDKKGTQIDMLNTMSDNHREDEKLAHQKVIDLQELALKRGGGNA